MGAGRPAQAICRPLEPSNRAAVSRLVGRSSTLQLAERGMRHRSAVRRDRGPLLTRGGRRRRILRGITPARWSTCIFLGTRRSNPARMPRGWTKAAASRCVGPRRSGNSSPVPDGMGSREGNRHGNAMPEFRRLLAAIPGRPGTGPRLRDVSRLARADTFAGAHTGWPCSAGGWVDIVDRPGMGNPRNFTDVANVRPVAEPAHGPLRWASPH